MINRKEIAKKIINGSETKAEIHNGGMKTACTSQCLAYFGIGLDDFRYSQYLKDVLSILRRHGHSCRSRKSSIKKGSTVGSVRRQLSKLGKGIYLIRVDGHVMLLDETGRTVVDTDPRKRDRRKILNIYKIGE